MQSKNFSNETSLNQDNKQLKKMPPRQIKSAIPFTEALDRTKFGKFNYFMIFIGGAILGNVVLETGSTGFILPVAECDLQLSNLDKGMLSSIGFVGIIVSSHLWGFLADTKGRRTVMIPTLLVGYAVTLISSLSHRYWLLLFLRFVNGFCISGSSATIYAYVSEFHNEKTRSRVMMASYVIFAFGSICMPIIGWAVINQSWSLPISFLGIVYKPWRLFIVVCGSPGLFCGLALILYPESPKFLLSVGKDKEAIETLRIMHKWNVGKGEDFQIDEIIPEKDITRRDLSEYEKNSAKVFFDTMWQQTAPLFKGKLLRTTAIVCTMQFWIFVTIHGMFMWFPYITNTIVDFMQENPNNKTYICDAVYDKQAYIYDDDDEVVHCTEQLNEKSYLYSLAIEVLFAVFFGLIGLIVHKVSKIHILFFLCVVFGACGPLTIHIHEPSVAMCTYVLLFIAGVGEQVLGGATAEFYPTHLRAMAVNISLMFGRLGGVAGANFVGLLLEEHCEMAFYIAGISLIICGFLGYLIPKPIPDSVETDKRESIEM